MTSILTPRRLVAVHAHPDDECIFTGGTLARYVHEGAHVTLVTCTNGEAGEVADSVDIGDAAIADVRLEELRASCEALGVTDVRLLGYRDSGMVNTPANSHPSAFASQDVAAAASRLSEILLQVRPQVVLTYDANGFYGHPDHIQAHRITNRALEMTRPSDAKLWHLAMPYSAMRRWMAAMSEEEFLQDEEQVMKLGVPDERVDAVIDVRAFLDAKRRALSAHRTQLGTTHRFLEVSGDTLAGIMGEEYFVADDGRPANVLQDLFEGPA